MRGCLFGRLKAVQSTTWTAQTGHWWQQVGKEYRQLIHIDDQPTVEIDFRGLHVAILSKEKGIPLKGDPYQLEPELLKGVDEKSQRAWVKHLVLTAINARTLPAAYQAFRERFPAGDPAKSLTNDQLGLLLRAFTEKHPHLEDDLGADQGIRLMHTDSEVARVVIHHFTAKEIPVLCVHDSFLVQEPHEKELQEQMDDATSMILGAPFKTETIRPRSIWNPAYDGDDVPEGVPQLAEGYSRRLEGFRRWRSEQGEVY